MTAPEKKLVLHFRVFCSESRQPALSARVDALLAYTNEACRDFGLTAEIAEPPVFMSARAVSPGTNPSHQRMVIDDLTDDYRDPTTVNENDIVAFLLEIGTEDGLWARDGGNNVLIDISNDSCNWVLAHEIGHLVGIAGHDDLTTLVMYGSPCQIAPLPPPATFTPVEQSSLLESPCAQPVI